MVPINYKDNLELFINVLNYHFYENINSSFKNNKVSDSINNEKFKEKLIIQKNALLFNNQQSNEEKIKKIDIQLIYLPYLFGAFNQFLYN